MEVAAHKSDQHCKTPNLAPWYLAFHGLVWAVVQVMHNAVGTDAVWRRVIEVNAEGGSWTTVGVPAGTSGGLVATTNVS